MNDEYLWDRSGEPDPELARLERALGGLSFVPRTFVPPTPVVEPRPRAWARRELGWGHALKVAVLSAATTMALIGSWRCLQDDEGGVEVRVIQVPAVTEPAPAMSEDDVPAEAVPAEAESTGQASDDALSADIMAPPEPSPKPRLAPTPRPRSKPEAVRPKRKPSRAPLAPPGDITARPTVEEILTGEPFDSSDRGSYKPSTADIKAGVAPVKAEALACGPRHGAAPGTRVRVELSVVGATGRVTQCSAIGDQQDTPLGRCVAEAFAKAQFEPFRAERIGFTYTLRMK